MVKWTYARFILSVSCLPVNRLWSRMGRRETGKKEDRREPHPILAPRPLLSQSFQPLSDPSSPGQTQQRSYPSSRGQTHTSPATVRPSSGQALAVIIRFNSTQASSKPRNFASWSGLFACGNVAKIAFSKYLILEALRSYRSLPSSISLSPYSPSHDLINWLIMDGAC